MLNVSQFAQTGQKVPTFSLRDTATTITADLVEPVSATVLHWFADGNILTF